MEIVNIILISLYNFPRSKKEKTKMQIQYTSKLTARKIIVEGNSRYECFDKLWKILGNNESRIDFFPATPKVIKK